MNVFLDTNAFYQYYGRDKLGMTINSKINAHRLNMFLNSDKNKVAISSITILEFLVHFENRPRIIKEVINFIKIKNIVIVPFGISNINSEILVQDFSGISDEVVKFRVEKYKRDKINAEAGFASLFLALLLKIYINFYLEREEKINSQFISLSDAERDKRKSELFGLLISDEIEKSLEQGASIFKKALKKRICNW